MFNLPGVVLASIVSLIAVHALRTLAPDAVSLGLLIDLAVVPARWTLAWDPSRLPDVLREVANTAPPDEVASRLAFARAVLDGGPRVWSAATYALLHGSWAHVILNSVWLAAFGTPVAQRCGSIRFLALALAAAVGGAAAHVLVHPLAVMPMIGASAAVSGMMGAAARFVFLPGPPGLHPPRSQALGLAALARNHRAMVFLAVWFATNILFAVIAAPLGLTDAAIAWEAHVGGFLAGLLLFPLLDRPPRPRRALGETGTRS